MPEHHKGIYDLRIWDLSGDCFLLFGCDISEKRRICISVAGGMAVIA